MPSCAHTWRNPFVSAGPPAPEVLVPGMSLDQVVAAVNLNASRIQSYQTNNATLSVPGVPGVPRLSGNIAAQRPKRLRLQASSLLGPEVDLGSNDELFWLWVRRNEPPALYYARHDQFIGSEAQRLLPIDPSWLLDALGMSTFAPGDQHNGPRMQADGTLEIRSVLQTPSGPMTKISIVDPRRAWVLQQHVYDSQGSLLASAVASEHRYYPEAQVSLPQRIEVQMPSAQLRLSIDVGTVELNQPAANPQMWELPSMTGFQPVDLGGASVGSAPLPTHRREEYRSPAPAPVTSVPITSISAPLRAQFTRPTTESRVEQLPPGGIASRPR
ncbi:hypothetical protein OAS39_07430 [Pirellulales bacterium]|nr:hypothetical protein [Pirellulales bacterium]